MKRFAACCSDCALCVCCDGVYLSTTFANPKHPFTNPQPQPCGVCPFYRFYDSLKEQQQKQTDEAKILQEQITTLQEMLNHTATQEPLLNPFALIPYLITFAKNENLTLNAFHPHPTLNALDIEGSGEFWQILNLLSFLESHHFLSLESLQLTLQENNQIHFYMLVMDIRQPSLQKQSPKE